MSAQLFTEDVLVVEEGPPGISRGLAKFLRPGTEISEVRPVRNREGTQIAAIEPVGKVPGAGGELVRWLLNPGRQSINVPYKREFVVKDGEGTPRLSFQNFGRDLLVSIPEQGEVGGVRNVSRFGGKELLLTFHEPPQRSRWQWKWGPALASLSAPPPAYPAEWQIVREDTVLARVVNPGSDQGGQSVLKFASSVEEPLRSLIVGLACALVYRNWIAIPERTTDRV